MEGQLTLDEYLEIEQQIKENLTGIAKSFVRIGHGLSRIDKSQAYKREGFKSTAEYAKAKYDMNPDGVSRFIKVYEQYSVPGDSPELREQYKEFKFAQLAEMLQLPDRDRELISPATKREDIRELKKFNKEGGNDPSRLFGWQQDFWTDLKEILNAILREEEELFDETCRRIREGREDAEAFAEEVNPSGNMVRRHGRCMAFFQEKEVKVKTLGQEEARTVSYGELLQAFAEQHRELVEQEEGGWWKKKYGKKEPERPVITEKKLKKEPVPEEKEAEEQQVPGQMQAGDYPELRPDKDEGQQNMEIAPAQPPAEPEGGAEEETGKKEEARRQREIMENPVNIKDTEKGEGQQNAEIAPAQPPAESESGAEGAEEDTRKQEEARRQREIMENPAIIKEMEEKEDMEVLENPAAELRRNAEVIMGNIRTALEKEDLQEAAFYAQQLLETIRAARYGA